MKNTGKIFLGLAATLAAGAVLGVLYAPDKGERTRRRIARKKECVCDTFDNIYEQGKESLEELRERLENDLDNINAEIKKLSRC